MRKRFIRVRPDLRGHLVEPWLMPRSVANQSRCLQVMTVDMQAHNAYGACMAQRPVQYTLRQVPPEVDRALRANARRQGESLNQVALAALARGLGLGDQPVEYDDLDALAGTWEEDPAFDTAIAEHDRVDPGLWS